MSNPVAVAMCGLGQWGPNLLRNLGQNRRARVVALCDASPKRLADFAPLHPGARLLASVGEVAADGEIEAVILATPAGLHEEQVRLLLDSGKHVLVEKPLAMSLAAARPLVELARKNARLLMVGHTFLHNPAVRRVKQEIEAGTLGRLNLLTAQRLSLGRIREDCNALWNLAPHDVSILLYWLGAMPIRVSARGMAFHEGHQQEDVALCHLEFPGRVLASIQVSWLNPVKMRQITVVGSQRMLVYDDIDTAAPVVLYDQRAEEVAAPPEGSLERFRLQVRSGPKSVLPVESTEPLALEIDHFLECVRTGAEPIGSGEEALRITAVLEACDRSMKANGATLEP